MNNNPSVSRTRYIPIPEWEKYHAWPTAGALRNLVFNKDKNGFAKVIKRIGRRILIDEAAFFEWVASK